MPDTNRYWYIDALGILDTLRDHDIEVSKYEIDLTALLKSIVSLKDRLPNNLEQQERVHKIFIFPIIKVWKKGKITGRRDALIDEKYNVDTIENWMYIKSYKLVKILGTITAKGKIFQPFPLPLNTLTKHFISIDTELIISQNPTIEEIQMFYVMGVYKIVIDENRNFAFKPLLIYHPLENERKVYLEQCLRALRIQKTLPPLDNATETSIVNDIVNANFECSKIFEGEFLAKDYFGG